MVCNVTGYGGILFPQFLNDLQQPVVLILGYRADSFSKDRKLFAITTADTCKERQMKCYNKVVTEVANKI